MSLQNLVDINFSNYVQIRREYDALLSSYEIQNTVMDKVLKQRMQSFEKALLELNPKPTKFDELLIPLTEKDLWENRTKAYDYLM